ncbi:MAG TPA: NCS2 family permease [Thermodesulfovibrionales bacterium]|nr:NCS2 family permease [Thermodesulfovibrionales bacterium]
MSKEYIIQSFFRLQELRTSVRQEAVAGATTFITMSYIIIVNPKILEAAGIPFGPSMVATILTAFIGTLLMGVYAKRPFAIAPYMGENAFVAFTVVKVLGYTWQVALGAIFVSGLLFALLTLLNIRTWLVNSIPEKLKIAFSVGIGLFLTFIGLNETGIVRLGVPGAPVQVGNLSEPTILLAVFGFILTGFLMIRKVNGAIFLGILSVTLVAIAAGLVRMPASIVSAPPEIAPVMAKLDISGALSIKALPVVLTMLVMIFVDTMGTLIGVSYKAGLLDKDGNLPEIEKPMLCDSASTMIGAFLGTTTSGAYIESATGIEAGGRSGLTSVVTAMLFLAALFFAPLFTVVPPYAYGPALIIVGMLMLSAIRGLQFDDLTDVIPVFTVIVLMSFTYNIGIGMTAGFVVYPVIKTLAGRIREVPPGLWFLALLSLLFFIFYPY